MKSKIKNIKKHRPQLVIQHFSSLFSASSPPRTLLFWKYLKWTAHLNGILGKQISVALWFQEYMIKLHWISMLKALLKMSAKQSS